MNISSNAVVMTNREFFQQREYAALCRIPGVREIMGAYADQRPALEQQYPDAAFALKIVSNLFFHDRELTNIHMNASPPLFLLKFLGCQLSEVVNSGDCGKCSAIVPLCVDISHVIYMVNSTSGSRWHRISIYHEFQFNSGTRRITKSDLGSFTRGGCLTHLYPPNLKYR